MGNLSKNATLLLQQRYCHPGETPHEVYRRVSEAMGMGDQVFARRLYNLMVKSVFLPNSPAIRNGGKPNGLLHACFVLPIADDINSIFKRVADMANIFKAGGGVGINFSPLRPAGTPLSSGGTSSGAVSFMNVFDTTTEIVKQGGFRRGALMGIMNYNHPEIYDFMSVKLNTNKLTNFNLSVLVDDYFMKACRDDLNIELAFNEKVYQIVRARDIFDKIVYGAWKRGDPSLVFYDRINQDNPLFPETAIVCTNPCAEVPLPPFGACTLGSINLTKFVKGNEFDFAGFYETCKLASKALLNVNKVSHYPLPEIAETMEKLNPFGLGVMGFADTLIMLGIKYDSEDCLKFIDELQLPYRVATNEMSPDSFYHRVIAPTGSLSILANCSSGIEPVFDTVFERHLTVGVIEETRDIYKSQYIRTAHEVSPEWHIKVLAQWQKYVDGGVSKTINLPYEATLKDIKDVFIQAWKLGVKGITVFRDGCLGEQGQVLIRKPNKCEEGSEVCHL